MTKCGISRAFSDSKIWISPEKIAELAKGFRGTFDEVPGAGAELPKPDKDGNQVLCGVYGTRFVEYLTVHRFDDEDRTPEIIATHLQTAMRQLWGPPLACGTAK